MLYSCTSLYLIYPERVCVIYNTGTYYVLNDIVYLSPLLQIFFFFSFILDSKYSKIQSQTYCTSLIF